MHKIKQRCETYQWSDVWQMKDGNGEKNRHKGIKGRGGRLLSKIKLRIIAIVLEE